MGWLQNNGGIAYPACVFDTRGVSCIIGRVAEAPRVITSDSINGDGTEVESYVISVEVLNGTQILCGKVGERVPAQPGEVVSIWVKGGNMSAGLAQALAPYRRDDVEVGGVLAIKYTHDGEASRGKNPPKQYHVEYQAPQPVGGSSASLLGAAQAPSLQGRGPEPFPPTAQTQHPSVGSILPQQANGPAQSSSLLP